MQTYAYEANKTPISIYQGRWNIMVSISAPELLASLSFTHQSIAPGF